MESLVPIIELNDDDNVNLDDEISAYAVPVVTLEDDNIDKHPVINLETDDIQTNSDIIEEEIKTKNSSHFRTTEDIRCGSIISDNEVEIFEHVPTSDTQNKISVSSSKDDIIELPFTKDADILELPNELESSLKDSPQDIEILPIKTEAEIVEIPKELASSSSKTKPLNTKFQRSSIYRKRLNERNESCNKNIPSRPSNKIQLNTSKDVQKADSKEKQYACDICFKEFSDKNILRMHYNTHTGEKPFACNICDKHFSNTVALRNHYETHIGEKPYVCDVCLTPFDKKSSLCGHKLDEHNFLTVI